MQRQKSHNCYVQIEQIYCTVRRYTCVEYGGCVVDMPETTVNGEMCVILVYSGDFPTCIGLTSTEC